MRNKVLFIHHVGYRGGAGTMLANIIASLDQGKFEPIVLCPDGDGIELLKAAGARVIVSPRPIYQFSHYTGYTSFALNPSFVLPVFRMWRDRSYWEKCIRDIGPRIVCLNAITLAPMANAARAAGAKVLCIVQETTVRGLLGLRTAWLNHTLTSRMDAVMFISEFDRKKSKCTTKITSVIPNWVDLSKYDRSCSKDVARKELSISTGARVVLMMGGISEIKGTLQLVRAVSGLTDVSDLLVLVAGYSEAVNWADLTRFQRLRLVLRRTVGREYRQRVLHSIKVNKLENRIRFIGMQSNVARLYAAADVVVFPAARPHQARPVLEAGAMARPVVVPLFPELCEFVEDGVNGLMFKPGDEKSLEDGLRRLLNDESLAQRLGANNYDNTVKKHNAAISSVRVNDLFERLLGR